MNSKTSCERDARPDLPEPLRSENDRRGASEPDSLGAKESGSMRGDPLKEIHAELREIRKLLNEGRARVDDLVDASYVARRTGIAERSVLEGKAGTNKIPRVQLGCENSRRPLVRFPRGAVDKFVADLVHKAVNQPRERSLRLLRRKLKSRRRAS